MAIDPNINFLQMYNPTHDTELLIRGLNRRLESYGKRMYHPEYLKDNETIHLSQYTELETKVYSILKRIPTPVKLTGMKGDYIQISRSKEVIKLLKPYMNDLKTLLNATPTWQDLIKNASFQAGRKLTRKEAIKEIENESDIRKLSDFQEFLADSEKVWDTDPQLTKLLEPFRGPRKGGTRQPGVPVAQSDVDALKNYLYQYRQDVVTGILGNRVIDDVPDDKADQYVRQGSRKRRLSNK